MSLFTVGARDKTACRNRPKLFRPRQAFHDKARKREFSCLGRNRKGRVAALGIPADHALGAKLHRRQFLGPGFEPNIFRGKVKDIHRAGGRIRLSKIQLCRAAVVTKANYVCARANPGFSDAARQRATGTRKACPIFTRLTQEA